MHAQWSVVFAQLNVGGRKEGIHGFLVRIRWVRARTALRSCKDSIHWWEPRGMGWCVGVCGSAYDRGCVYGWVPGTTHGYPHV